MGALRFSQGTLVTKADEGLLRIELDKNYPLLSRLFSGRLSSEKHLLLHEVIALVRAQQDAARCDTCKRLDAIERHLESLDERDPDD